MNEQLESQTAQRVEYVPADGVYTSTKSGCWSIFPYLSERLNESPDEKF